MPKPKSAVWLTVAAYVAALPPGSPGRATIYRAVRDGKFGKLQRVANGHYEIRSDAPPPKAGTRGARVREEK